MKKRILSLVMALVLAVGLLPVGAMAAGNETQDPISVTMTIYNQGVFASCKDNTPMMQKTVSFTDANGDGNYSLDEALSAAHTLYAPNGASDYTSGDGEYGYSVSKLWGAETSAVGFYKNHMLTSAVNEENLSNGDYVVAFVYKDQTNWSDRYAYFTDDRIVTKVNEEFSVTLYYDSWGTVSPQATAPLGVFDSSGNYSVPSTLRGEKLFDSIYMKTVSTDSNGIAKMSFTETGTYILTAQYDSSNYTDYYNDPPQYYLVPPICTVTVLSEEDYNNYLTELEKDRNEQLVAAAKEKLTWDLIKGLNTSSSSVIAPLSLPAQVTLDDNLGTVSVSWTSSNTDVITNDGMITRPAESTEITLTATLTAGTETSVVSFTVTATPPSTANADAVKIAALMEGIASGYTDTYNNSKVIIDMAAYEDFNSATTHKTTADAKQKYVNFVTSSVTDSSVGDSTFALSIVGLQSLGYDPQQLYPVNSNTALNIVTKLNSATHSESAWSAPYTLAAYNQGNYGTASYEQALVSKALASQDTETGSWSEWGDSIQTTSNMIVGLSFYRDQETVQAAINKAVTYLSNQQKANGTFDAYGYGPDADACANVVTALAAAGINPDTDERFIKNGNSALDGLLTFALDNNSGFGYQDNTTLSAYATEEGFRALIAAYQVMSTGRAYNVYDFSANEVVPGRATGTGAVAPPTTPPETNKDITVTVTVKADTGYWLQNKSVTVDEGSTAYHAFVKALDGSGITQVGAENGYVESMTKNGTTLAEFTKGEASGWLYKVNETLPDVGLTDYTISDGDSIVWYYTEDWTKDPQASSGSSPLPETAMDKVEALIDKIGTVTADSGQAIQAAREAYDKLTDAQKKLVENYDVLKKAEAAYAALTSALPFTDIADHWALEAIQYVYEKDLMNGVSDAVFAPNKALNRAMLATILYRMEGSPIVTAANPYSDVAADTWYTDAVIWASENGIVNGYGSGKFGPTDNITREQLAAMLLRYSDYKEYDTDARNHLTSYTDAGAISAWALESVQWANAEGLVTGRTETTIVPKGSTTRAETATILMRYLEKAAG